MRYTKKANSEDKEKRSSKLPVEVNEEEYTQLVNAPPSRHHRLGFMFAWESGLRVSEVINLRPEDINEVEGSMRINGGKGDKDRIVPLPKNWTHDMLEFLPLPCSKRALQKAFEVACKKIGLYDTKPTVHFHSLRHGFATHQLRLGMKLSNIQMALGHSDLATTSIYLRLVPAEMIQEYKELNA